MKINSNKKNSLSILATISIAIILIGSFVIVINVGLNNASLLKDKVVHAENIGEKKIKSNLEDLEFDSKELLSKYRIIVNADENRLPLYGANYPEAIAIAENIAKNVLNTPITGRIEMTLNFTSWSILAETENGGIRFNIAINYGSDDLVSLTSEGMLFNWDSFDSKYNPDKNSSTPTVSFNSSLNDNYWNDPWYSIQLIEGIVYETKHIPEDEYNKDDGNIYRVPTNEEIEKALKEEKNSVIKYMNSMKNSPLKEKAINIVDDLGLGRGLETLEANVVGRKETKYIIDSKETEVNIDIVEVKLENSTYIILSIIEDTNQVFGYERFSNSYLDTYYPNY